MHRPWLHSLILLLLDAGALLLALWAAFGFWVWHDPQLEYVVQVRLWELFLPNPWIPPVLVLLPAWLFANRLQGLLDPARLESSIRIASSAFRSTLYVLALVVVLQFLLADRAFSRLLTLAFLALGFLSVTTVRLAFFRIQLRLPRPMAVQNVAIYGSGPEARSMRERLDRYARHAYEVVGYVVPSDDETRRVPDAEVLGTVRDFKAIVNRHDLHIVILATRETSRAEAFQLVRLCDQMGLRILEMPFTWGFASPRLSFASIGGLQLIDLQTLSYPTAAENLKRTFDLVAVLFGGLTLMPLLLAAAAAIRLTSPGPVLYVSPRVGRGGRHFPFYKFRSMVHHAETLRNGLEPRNEADGRLFKMRRDPRITPVGRYIRRWSIDELAQLWNVIRGDMNLVGPRPLPVEDLVGIERDPEAAYWFELRSKVKPGITGLWQVSGRSDLTFADMVALDIQYVQNWSLWLDLQILLKTVPAVLRGSGAA